MEDESPGREVVPLKEVPRVPMHCGKPMRRVIVGETTGRPRYHFLCQDGDAQEKGPPLPGYEPKESTA